jgi:hypothetical protein
MLFLLMPRLKQIILTRTIMKLQVTFTVDVNFCDEDLGPVESGDPLAERIEDSVAEAVKNALDKASDDGFDHDLENVITIVADNPVVAKLV